MINLGTVRPGSTIYIPFESFASATGAPITLTGLATSDILIYKDGGTTQRASASGFTLLDTDGIDFDALTGIHGVSIDLADNTTADFYQSGSRYFVVIGDVTVDSQTMRFIAATFRIGHEAAVLDTFIATLASQTSFTLNAGPAEDDALNGCVVAIHDTASAVQQGFAVISDYTGASKTVTLVAGTTFTVAAKDNISVFPRTSVHAWNGTAVPTEHTAGYPIVTIKDGTGTGEINTNAGAIAVVDLVTTLTTYTGNTVQTGDSFARIGATGSGLTTLATASALSTAAGNITSILGFVDTEIATIVTDVAAILVDTAEIGVAGAGLTNINLPNQTMDIVGNITGNLSGSVGSVTGAVGSVTGAVGSVTGAVGSIATGGITAASFGAGAIDAAAIATDAIGSAELAATAVSKIWTTALTEAYAANDVAPTGAQALFLIMQMLTEFAISGVTLTVKKLDGTSAATFTLDSSTVPTSITRAT